MDLDKITKALSAVLAEKGSKKFEQSVDITINLKEIDLKKNEQQIDFFLELPHFRGKPVKVCGLVGPELFDESKAVLDETIEAHNFGDLKSSPAKVKKLAQDFDFFVAQATIMPQIASAFGRVLGSRGKMPNPKAGCVVPPKAQLTPLKSRLEKTARVIAKTSSSIKLSIGKESLPVDVLAENALAVYNGVIANTPQGINNIKDISVKLTMGKPVRVE